MHGGQPGSPSWSATRAALAGYHHPCGDDGGREPAGSQRLESDVSEVEVVATWAGVVRVVAIRRPVDVLLALLGSGMPNEGEVYFVLFGDDFDPTSLSIGIAPTRTRRKAHPTPKRSSWVYSTGKMRNDLIDVYEMASSLVATLGPHVDRILEAKQAYGLEAVLEVVITITLDETKSTPAIGFDSRVISFLNRVGASIDIDTYRGKS